MGQLESHVGTWQSVQFIRHKLPHNVPSCYFRVKGKCTSFMSLRSFVALRDSGSGADTFRTQDQVAMSTHSYQDQVAMCTHSYPRS